MALQILWFFKFSELSYWDELDKNENSIHIILIDIYCLYFEIWSIVIYIIL